MVQHLRPIVCRAVQLYSQLSGQAHPSDMAASNSKVLLVEGPLSREDMRFLECVAGAVRCPCELRYKDLPTAITQGKGLAAGAEGQPPAAAAGTECQ